tara:strand:+ start:918 stop:1211 length:294 start_codon:yes stop_codon:yes gene_type:complete
MEHFYTIVFILLLSIINFSFLGLLTKENFTGYFIAQPTKCFSCERQLPKGRKYLGGPTKCFSCEREILARYGGDAANLAQPTKCFSCERQMGKPLFR